MPEFKIGNTLVGTKHPTYFIADISANHDGSLNKAIDLITRAKGAGASCAKFQHFRADHIVSKYGFDKVGKLAHQAGWKEDVYEAFQRLAVPWEWTPFLSYACKTAGIEFMSTPYDIEAVDHLDPYVTAYKIGSGDITFTQLIRYVSQKGKPVLIATGASDLMEVVRATQYTDLGNPLCIMQCNTNYTGEDSNYSNLNLRVIKEYQEIFPRAVIGLSDHTVGHVAVLGAVALGARIIEKHFTDNSAQAGPDHSFSLIPEEWREMVQDTRRLEKALGNGLKVVESNEALTVILQRRCLRAIRDLTAGEALTAEDVVALRPAPAKTLDPFRLVTLLAKNPTVRRSMVAGEEFTDDDLQ